MRLAVSLLILVAAPVFADTAAVLPFANRTSVTDPAQASLDWIGESIAETVRDAIGSRGAVTPSRAETGEAYRQLNLRPLSILTEASMLKIGEALDAEQVVYGSFEFLADPAAAHVIFFGIQPHWRAQAAEIGFRRRQPRRQQYQGTPRQMRFERRQVF